MEGNFISFCRKCNCHTQGEFLDHLCEVIKNQRHFDGIPPQVIYFSNSFSPKGIAVYLNNESFEQAVFQLATSLVFQLDNEVYKMPLDFTSERTLKLLYFDNLTSHIKPKQMLLPENILKGNNVDFCVPSFGLFQFVCCFSAKCSGGISWHGFCSFRLEGAKHLL